MHALAQIHGRTKTSAFGSDSTTYFMTNDGLRSITLAFYLQNTTTTTKKKNCGDKQTNKYIYFKMLKV